MLFASFAICLGSFESVFEMILRCGVPCRNSVILSA